MDKLPDVPLLLIFGFFNDNRERIILERVCRRWRQIMQKYGWSKVRRIELHYARWIKPIGRRCGHNLLNCCFYRVDIDHRLIRLIDEHLPALKHLNFQNCRIKIRSVLVHLQQRLGTRLRSLNFHGTDFDHHQNRLHYFLLHFLRPLRRLSCFNKYHDHQYQALNEQGHLIRLHHLGLDFPQTQPNVRPFQFKRQLNFDSIFIYISADLRSLFLGDHQFSSSDQEQILVKVQSDCPKLAALHIDTAQEGQPQLQILNRISDLKSLHFLRISPCWYSTTGAELLRNCLDNLPQLHGLKMDQLLSEDLPIVFRSSAFHGLVHLSITFIHPPRDYEIISRLSTIAPQLRSLHLDSPDWYLTVEEQINNGLEGEILKIAHNGILEYLNVPDARFEIWKLDQLIRLCPNLHSLGLRLLPDKALNQDTTNELRRVVMDQWRDGTRKHLPLQIWVYCEPDVSWPDHFLTIHFVHFNNWFVPPNPVLNSLFRDEVFNDNDGGGTPSFVTDHYLKINRWLEII